MTRREAAVAAEEEQASKMVREFGATARLGEEDAIQRVADLTTRYVKEVLRSVWMAGRPDVAASMCAAFDDAPIMGHLRSPCSRHSSRSRSVRRTQQRQPDAESLNEAEEAKTVKEDVPPEAPGVTLAEAIEVADDNDELPDFSGDSDA